MLNIDGVIYGNYRLNLLGKDMNRLWIPSLAISPDECDESSLYINNVIDMIKKTLYCRNIYFYCDFHGHSGKQNFFLYGCPKEGMENFHKKFMEIYSKRNNIFSLSDCMHKIMPNKMNTCRALLKHKFNIDLSYCLETSMYSYNIKGENDKKVFPFTIEKYKQIGMDFCLSLFDFINPQNEEIFEDNKNNENNINSLNINNNISINEEDQAINTDKGIKNENNKMEKEQEKEEEIGTLNINKYFVI